MWQLRKMQMFDICALSIFDSFLALVRNKRGFAKDAHSGGVVYIV